MDAVSLTRADLVRHGQHLEYFTLAWNSLEAVISIVAGVVAGSVALVGFGGEWDQFGYAVESFKPEGGERSYRLCGAPHNVSVS